MYCDDFDFFGLIFWYEECKANDKKFSKMLGGKNGSNN